MRKLELDHTWKRRQILQTFKINRFKITKLLSLTLYIAMLDLSYFILLDELEGFLPARICHDVMFVIQKDDFFEKVYISQS